jgi:uncharacterized protein YdeI (YjbR/CyaY-like superfamily)
VRSGLDLETLEVSDAAGWRRWLRDNHLKKQGVWLVFLKGEKSISYDEAIDEALAGYYGDLSFATGIIGLAFAWLQARIENHYRSAQ